MSKPAYIGYVVSKPAEGSDAKPVWREVAAAWHNRNGEGFSVVIPDGISLSGRVVFLPPRDDS